MATLSTMHPLEGRPIYPSAFKMSWGAVLGGMFVALGVFLLLTVLGLAAGLTAINPENAQSAKGAGIGIGVGIVIASLIALFVGGLVASRTAGIVDRSTGVTHGAVLWGITTLIGVLMLGSVVGMVTSAAASIGRGVVGIAAPAVAGAVTGGAEAAEAVGIDMNDVLAPVNQRLADQGKPPVTPAQLQAAAQDVVSSAVREGRFDRAALTAAIVENTSLSRADAQEIANRFEVQWSEQRDALSAKAEQAREDIQHGALTGADRTGKALWWVFFGMLAGLGAAIGGSAVGVSRRQRFIAEGVVPLIGPEEAIV